MLAVYGFPDLLLDYSPNSLVMVNLSAIVSDIGWKGVVIVIVNARRGSLCGGSRDGTRARREKRRAI